MKKDFQDIDTRVQILRERYMARGQDRKAAIEKANRDARTPVAVGHPHQCLVAPNALLRSPLFRVAQTRAAREDFKEHYFPLQGSRGGYVEYSGQELRQSDGDVFMALLRAEQRTPGFAVIRLTPFAKEIGWGASSDAIRRVKDSLIRMSNTNVVINSFASSAKLVMPQKVEFSLVVGYTQEATGEWLVYLDGRLRLLKPVLYTRIPSSYLSKLSSGAVLASWLLKYFSSHRQPLPISFDELRRYSGAASKPAEFRRCVRQAIEQLRRIGFLESFSENGEMLKVTRALFQCENEAGDVAEQDNADGTFAAAENAADT